MRHVVLEHRVVEPVVPEQEGSGPAVLGHKVDTLVALRHRGFVPSSLGRQDFEPIDLQQEDSPPAAAGFDLDPVPARVDLVDMYTRVAATRFGFVVPSADLAVAKFAPRAAEVGLARVWVERYAEHTASAVAQLAATVERTDLVVVASDLATG